MHFAWACRPLLFGSWLLASATLAAADPPPAKGPSREERQKYAELLNRGRSLESANKLADAAKALTECLSVAPDDPTALSELGYVQYRAGDLNQAEITTRKAVARAEGLALKAASLYNLALILNAKHQDQAGAVAALEQSLRLRPNTTVQALLAKLDPKAVARVRAGVSAMTGPVLVKVPAGAATEEKLRKQVCWKSLAEQFPDLGVVPGDAKTRIKCDYELIVNVPGNAFNVRIWKSIGDYNWPKEVATLAIYTNKGWYLTHFDSFWGNRWSSGEIKIVSAEVLELGKRPVLMLRWQQSSDKWTWGLDESKNRDSQEGRIEKANKMLFASIGPSGTPSVTAEIPIGAEAAYGEQRETKQSDVVAALAVSFSPSGEVILTGPTVQPTKVPKKKYADLLPPLLPGTFALDFP